MEPVSRRQARKTRILENSENRLQRILEARSSLEKTEAVTSAEKESIPNANSYMSNVHASDEDANNSNISVAKDNALGEFNGSVLEESSDEHDIADELRNRRANNASLKTTSSRVFESFNGISDDSEGTRGSGNSDTYPLVQGNFVYYPIYYKYVYIVLAIAVRLLLFFETASFIKESAIIPFMGVCLFHITLEYVIGAKFKTNGPDHVNGFLSILGMSPAASNIVMGLYNLCADIFKFFSLYMFTFVCTHLIIEYFSY